jgi:methanogenic corrinoid protein MtbC1
MLEGNRRQALDRVIEAVRSGVLDIREVYLQVIPMVQYEVGRLWQGNEISVAQEHYCTAVTQMLISMLFPLIEPARRKPWRMLGCCVGRELHELGMRTICDYFELEGWETYFVGSNVPVDEMIRTISTERIGLACISVTMSYNVHLAEKLIRQLRASPDGPASLRIMVGGHPFNRDRNLWREIGADASGVNAREAVELAERLLGNSGETP